MLLCCPPEQCLWHPASWEADPLCWRKQKQRNKHISKLTSLHITVLSLERKLLKLNKGKNEKKLTSPVPLRRANFTVIDIVLYGVWPYMPHVPSPIYLSLLAVCCHPAQCTQRGEQRWVNFWNPGQVLYTTLSTSPPCLWQSGCGQFLYCHYLPDLLMAVWISLAIVFMAPRAAGGKVICQGFNQCLFTLLKSSSGCLCAVHLNRALTIHLWSTSGKVCEVAIL